MNHLSHTSPLRALADKLMQGETLRERCIKLRWRRKRSKPRASDGFSLDDNLTTNQKDKSDGQGD